MGDLPPYLQSPLPLSKPSYSRSLPLSAMDRQRFSVATIGEQQSFAPLRSFNLSWPNHPQCPNRHGRAQPPLVFCVGTIPSSRCGRRHGQAEPLVHEVRPSLAKPGCPASLFECGLAPGDLLSLPHCGGINPYTLMARLRPGDLAHHETDQGLIQLLGVSQGNKTWRSRRILVS